MNRADWRARKAMSDDEQAARHRRVERRLMAARVAMMEAACAPVPFWSRPGRWTMYEHPQREVTHESVQNDMRELPDMLRDAEPDIDQRRQLFRSSKHGG